MENETKEVTQFLDQEYAAYGMYTIEHRAIPSVIDGFKPTQRKIAHIANRVWKSGKEKPMKIFQLAGKIAAEAAYHHGDASLNSAIIGMAQSFKNSMPLLDEIGQFGSLRAPEAGAPRYISTKLTENFNKLYKDHDLLTPKYDDGMEIEPEFFLPIIPAVLLNGSSGIAVGFATNILNRNPLELAKYCLNYLEGKRNRDILPWRKDFNGIVEKTDTNSYSLKGLYEVVNTTTVKISELPPSMTFQKFEELLDRLQDKGIIKHYDDSSSKNPAYEIKFARNELSKLIENDKLESTLKLIENESENLTCLDEHGKLIEFNNITELIDHFMKVRSSYYVKRKDKLISDLNDRIQYLSNRARFIKMVISDELKIRNVPKATVEKSLDIFKFDRINDSYGYLLGMPIHSLTKETFESILNEVKEKKEELKGIKSTEPGDMYKSDLKELIKVLSK